MVKPSKSMSKKIKVRVSRDELVRLHTKYLGKYISYNEIPLFMKCEAEPLNEDVEEKRTPCCDAPWFKSVSTKRGTRLICNLCGKEKGSSPELPEKLNLMTRYSEQLDDLTGVRNRFEEVEDKINELIDYIKKHG